MEKGASLRRPWRTGLNGAGCAAGSESHGTAPPEPGAPPCLAHALCQSCVVLFAGPGRVVILLSVALLDVALALEDLLRCLVLLRGLLAMRLRLRRRLRRLLALPSWE
eukprot:6258591-Pyramimonas_sp.AAC.1